MMIQAVLGNPHHPEYGVATIPFPIPHDQYAHCMELLEALEIGDAVKADCQVQEINSFYLDGISKEQIAHKLNKAGVLSNQNKQLPVRPGRPRRTGEKAGTGRGA